MVLPQTPSNRPITANPQKRRIPSLLIQTAEDELHRPSKRQKPSYLTFPPARFWDSLSKIPLTRNALRELNERNAKKSCRSASPRKLPGRGSNFLHQQAVPLRFARQGGPDLRELRGVCGKPCATALMLTESSTGYQRTQKTTWVPDRRALGDGREGRSRQQRGAPTCHRRTALPQIRQARGARGHMIGLFSSI